MRTCVCGNAIGDPVDFKVTISPCRCQKPGPGRSIASHESYLDDITATQYAQRKRAGLPIVCEVEKSLLKEIR